MQFLRGAIAMADVGETTDGSSSLVVRGRFGIDVAASGKLSTILRFVVPSSYSNIFAPHAPQVYGSVGASPLH